jgi:molybdenum cofactor cytidylyltransferase
MCRRICSNSRLTTFTKMLGLRIARSVAGEGIRIAGPVTSRYNLVSERKGLLRVNIGLLKQVNRVEGVTLFSLLDRQPVLPGKIVAGVKVTPIAVPEANLCEVERLRPRLTAAFIVLPFARQDSSVVATKD